MGAALGAQPSVGPVTVLPFFSLSVGSYGLKVLAENIKMGENSSSSMPEMGTRLAGFRSSSRPDSVKVDSC